MKKFNRESFEVRATVLKAMANPTRLYIIEVLNKNTCSVNELTEMIGADVSTVSKHLSVLKNAGLIGSEKKGNQVYYHLSMPCALTFLGCVEDVVKEQIRYHQDALK